MQDYVHNSITPEEFLVSREMLDGKPMTLREKGKRKRKRKEDYLSEVEKTKLHHRAEISLYCSNKPTRWYKRLLSIIKWILKPSILPKNVISGATE